MSCGNYYISSFFWGTLAKVFNAIFGFISVPLLLGYFGKGDYGILSIATACNGYMHLMDLGMNTGAVKFYSQWKAEGKQNNIYRVARTNLTFYIIISIINSICLVCLALWGEGLFSINKNQYMQLQICLYILALFSIMSWCSTVFTQLLIADKQIAFTQQVNCIQVLLKCILVVIVLRGEFSLSVYFFWLTLLVAIALIPFAYKCLKCKLIDSLKPALYWTDFKIVLVFSLSIFALSLFQITASHSRPIILSMFAIDGAETVADYRIIEVIPQLIIMIGGTFSSIFLPKAAELITNNKSCDILSFATKWTSRTTIIMVCLCFPFILCAKEVLSAYVGQEYDYLSHWLVLWCFIVLIQMHSTPCYSLIIANGKTKSLVTLMSISCLISICVNAILCKKIAVGSAIVGYSIYVIIVMAMYYLVFYKKYLGLSRIKIFMAFFKPTFIGCVCAFIMTLIPYDFDLITFNSLKLNYIETCILKSVLWFLFYFMMLLICKMIPLKR